MKIYDISQEIFTGFVYPGDTPPSFKRVMDIDKGDIVNLSDIEMCLHNGTHIDAPSHFVGDGKNIESVSLEKCIGEAAVINGINDYAGEKRVIFTGEDGIDIKTAGILADAGVYLVGVSNQSIGNADVHRLLLGRETVVLEGLKLDGIKCGKYNLIAVPLKFGGCEGSPCRALLISDEG